MQIKKEHLIIVIMTLILTPVGGDTNRDSTPGRCDTAHSKLLMLLIFINGLRLVIYF
jgi:hypothetical protein